MWTPATRRQHSRDGLRYETDLTDAEWALIEPLMPKPLARGRPGMASARGYERDLLCAARRRCVAATPNRSAASDDRVPMVQRVAGYRPVRDDEPPARHGGPGAGRTRGFAECCCSRQPERQDH